jgi:thioredoxin reductase (NADPH)
MDTPDRSGHIAASRTPVLFVADGDLQARDVLQSALVRRFGADYRVVTADTAADGLQVLQRLAQDGDDVAIVAADVHLPEMDAVEFLQQAYALHPRSSRVLLVPMDRYHTWRACTGASRPLRSSRSRCNRGGTGPGPASADRA